MKIEWDWEDGYVANRPHQVIEIDDEELEGMTPEAREEYIDVLVKDEFQNRVSFWWREKK
jgi:hypothetical protein